MLHVKQPLGDTAMHLAARRRDSSLLKTLIEAGAQVSCHWLTVVLVTGSDWRRWTPRTARARP